MRFAGWCTTDIAYYAYGINVYDYYFKQKKPCWERILNNKEGKIYSIIIADLPSKIKKETIKEIDYQKLLAYFEKPLELRKIDYLNNPII